MAFFNYFSQNLICGNELNTQSTKTTTTINIKIFLRTLLLLEYKYALHPIAISINKLESELNIASWKIWNKPNTWTIAQKNKLNNAKQPTKLPSELLFDIISPFINS
jgi:hypothetical protein